MKSQQIDIFWFSGTGNTLLVAEVLKETFEKNGKKVKLFNIENSSSLKIDRNHAIGLGFPVAMQSTYPFVWKFIKKLPESVGTEIFMFDTLATFSGGIVGPVKKMLSKKGYNCIGAAEFIMPNNLFGTPPSEKCSVIIDKTLKRVTAFAYNLLNNKAQWKRIPVLSDIMYLLSSWPQLWKIFGKWIKVNHEKCKGCVLCVKLCPVNNIELKSNVAVKHKKCEICMRCVSFCPSNAIFFKKEGKKAYRAARAENLL